MPCTVIGRLLKRTLMLPAPVYVPAGRPTGRGSITAPGTPLWRRSPASSHPPTWEEPQSFAVGCHGGREALGHRRARRRQGAAVWRSDRVAAPGPDVCVPCARAPPSVLAPCDRCLRTLKQIKRPRRRTRRRRNGRRHGEDRRRGAQHADTIEGQCQQVPAYAGRSVIEGPAQASSAGPPLSAPHRRPAGAASVVLNTVLLFWSVAAGSATTPVVNVGSTDASAW